MSPSAPLLPPGRFQQRLWCPCGSVWTFSPSAPSAARHAPVGVRAASEAEGRDLPLTLHQGLEPLVPVTVLGPAWGKMWRGPLSQKLAHCCFGNRGARRVPCAQSDADGKLGYSFPMEPGLGSGSSCFCCVCSPLWGWRQSRAPRTGADAAGTTSHPGASEPGAVCGQACSCWGPTPAGSQR